MSTLSVWLATASSNITAGANQACANGANCNVGTGQLAHIFANIANFLTILIGALSVIMIIIGGLRYVISNGDQKNVTAAKDTILYAVIGVIVAIVAFAIVQFVTTTIGR
jgi:cytochrome bd-type quinol oxidase subunit 2